MRVAIVGLGKMGMNMAKRLLASGIGVTAYNRTPARTEELIASGAEAAYSITDIIDKLKPPRTIWLMLPAGKITDNHINMLSEVLSADDTIIEGGNSYYKDSIKRSEKLRARSIGFMDAGVSGGIWGRKIGYCLMIGGNKDLFTRHEPVFKALAPKDGYMHCGPVGAGHFVKMIHNGIEYGMMQAIGEGFDLIENSPFGRYLTMLDYLICGIRAALFDHG